jgi:antitoxin component YwqK of YwqJK toxin-antitoxin module
MVFLMSFSLFAQNENNLVKLEKNGDLEKVVIFYESGELHQVGFIKNDKLHGEWKSFDKNGNPLAEANYKKGMKIGKWTFWKNGEKIEVNFNNIKTPELKVLNDEVSELVSN